MINTSTVKLRLLTGTSCILQKRWKKRMQQNAIHWTSSGLRADGLSSSLATDCGTESEGTHSASPQLLTGTVHAGSDNTGNSSEPIRFQTGVQGQWMPQKPRGEKRGREKHAVHMLTVQKTREHRKILFPIEIFLSLT